MASFSSRGGMTSSSLQTTSSFGTAFSSTSQAGRERKSQPFERASTTPLPLASPGALTSLADVLGLRVLFEPRVRLPGEHPLLPPPPAFKSSGLGRGPGGAGADFNVESAIALRVAELTHRVWAPVSGRLKDYITTPKNNGYRSVHTTVLWGSLKAEVQIRSTEMHYASEYGLAAHWLYKQQTRGVADQEQAQEAPARSLGERFRRVADRRARVLGRGPGRLRHCHRRRQRQEA
ncbi:hypothetical protein T492DRAFT_61709 [Pavlovales sp. CCMP2436]|nr:hypothetical protein T492DRAFT_61709 [Pavlovales sp. CCMP2436]